ISEAIMKLEEYETGCGLISHVEVAITPEWCAEIKVPNISKSLHRRYKSRDSVTLDQIIGKPQDTLYAWTSTMSGELNDGVENAETDKSFFGVQLRLMSDLVEA